MKFFLCFSCIGVLAAFSLSLSNISQSARAESSIPAFDARGIRASSAMPTTLYFPLVSNSPDCSPIPGEIYGSLPILGAPTNNPAEQHPDINLALRGYALTNAFKGLVDYIHPTDPGAPQLNRLFGDNRVPVFSNVYQVYDWNWAANRRGNAITDPPVTLAGMTVAPDEIIRVPGSGYPISRPRLPNGYSVMVLYAAMNRVTLKYTREDDVVIGFTLHIENICVEPNLRALYQSLNSAGRTQLPAMNAGQGIGRALGTEIGVVIRDTGSFMDPRSRQDWWQGTLLAPARVHASFTRVWYNMGVK